MKSTVFACVVAILAAGSASAAPKRKSASEIAANAGSADKAHFEAFLKDRINKLNDAHKARVKFMDDEKAGWDAYWATVREERRKFEIRITRQALDLFESLASLDDKDKPATVANFQKLQDDLIKSFDMHQKQKMADFFASHESRWRDFAARQDQERQEFMADAESSLQQSPTMSAAGGDDQEAPPPPSRPAKSAKASRQAARASDSDEAEVQALLQDNPQPQPQALKKKPAAKKKPVVKEESDDSSDSDSDSPKKDDNDPWH